MLHSVKQPLLSLTFNSCLSLRFLWSPGTVGTSRGGGGRGEIGPGNINQKLYGHRRVQEEVREGASGGGGGGG